jgi:hypothetical protein
LKLTYVHKNFKLLSAGDFIHKDGHVVIATGKIIIENGKVTWFQTLEAKGTDEGGKLSILRLLRGIVSFIVPTPSSNPEQRTKDNSQQKVVKEKENF